MAALFLAGIAVVAGGWSAGVGWALVVAGGALFVDQIARPTRADRRDAEPRTRRHAVPSGRTRVRQPR